MFSMVSAVIMASWKSVHTFTATVAPRHFPLYTLPNAVVCVCGVCVV
jgi:hypothetical protein